MNQFDPRYMQLLISKLNKIINKEQTVISIAKDLNISRQTIHKYLARYKRFGEDGLIKPQTTRRAKPAHNKTNEVIEQCVIQFAANNSVDGVQTLADKLQYEYNLSIHPTTIYRILKRNNIRYTKYYLATKKRWKRQLFSHQIPGQELQMDTQYPFGYKQGKVIYTIIDDATRWAFVWSYDQANAMNTEDFVKRVIARVPFIIQKIRTDQGKEFTNFKLKELLNKYNINHRLNTPYCPEENGKIERFHGTLNQKAFRYKYFTPNQSLDHIQYHLNLFMYYYNYQKKHRGLGMDGKTPIQRLIELSSVNLTLQYHNY